MARRQSTSLIVDEFEFDCPQTKCSLTLSYDQNMMFKNWFEVAHERHEQMNNDVPETNDIEIDPPKEIRKISKIGELPRRVSQIEPSNIVASSVPVPKIKVDIVSFQCNPKKLVDSSKKSNILDAKSASISDSKNLANKRISEKVNESSKKLKSSAKTSNPAASSTNDDILNLLKQHNKKFQAKPLYVPPQHSVRDIKKWEKITGRFWNSCNPEERDVINHDIANMKLNKVI